MIKNSNDKDLSQPTEMVVSLVVAMRGQSTGYMSSVRSLAEVKACLQGLAADALTDQGDNVMAVELMWTPSESGVTISQARAHRGLPRAHQILNPLTSAIDKITTDSCFFYML